MDLDPEQQLKAIGQPRAALERINEEWFLGLDTMPRAVVCGRPDWDGREIGCAAVWESPEVNPDGSLGYLWCGEHSDLLAMASGLLRFTFSRNRLTYCPNEPVASFRCRLCNTERSISGIALAQRNEIFSCRRCQEWLAAVQLHYSNGVSNSAWAESPARFGWAPVRRDGKGTSRAVEGRPLRRVRAGRR